LGAIISTVGLEFFEDAETAFSISARNLLDADGPDPGFAGIDYPLVGRTVLFELRQEL
jgi:hypothetical protein